MPSPSPTASQPCPTCSGPIVWTTTIHGRPLPVNAEPDHTGRGNTAVYEDHTGTHRSRQLTHDRERPGPESFEWRAMPHWATSPRCKPRHRKTSRRRNGVRPGPWRRPA